MTCFIYLYVFIICIMKLHTIILGSLYKIHVLGQGQSNSDVMGGNPACDDGWRRGRGGGWGEIGQNSKVKGVVLQYLHVPKCFCLYNFI